jgi:cobalt-zinc-cadmium efflux system protein
MSGHHSHSPRAKNYNKDFVFGITLNIIYIIVEVVYGIMADSLALIADAGHNLSDVLGLLLAWGASYLVKKSARGKYTYGFRKSSVLAALLNALILLVAIGAIMWEALGRFTSPQIIEGKTVMIVAGIGVIINSITALLFFSGREHDLNIKGAFLHMAADAGISLGVVFVGLILTFSDLFWLDPVVSIVIALIIFWGTWGLLKDSFNLALDAIPAHIDKEEIEDYFESVPEIESYHDLHIWALSTTETALTVHAVVNVLCDRNKLIDKISKQLWDKFHIIHTTIQIEDKGETDCNQNQI